MKTLFLFLALPLMAFFVSDKLDEDNGFGAYKFGTPPSQYSDLNLEIDEGKTKLYSSVDNYIPVKGTKITSVQITFCRNMLSAISMVTDKKTGNNLLGYLINKYGTPQKVKGNYEWMGKKVQLLYEPIDDFDAKVSFFSREIYEHKK
jgi:hypothetical protein